MKRLIVTFGLLLTAMYIMAQVSNVAEFRIANATTQFGVNLPVGTKVFNIATGEYWVATSGVALTATLTSASASFSKLNDSGTDDQNASEVQVTASGNLTSTDVQAALTELQGDIDGISDTDDQTAAEVDVTASGNLSSTNVQDALVELQGDIDGISATDDQTASEVNISDTDNDYTATTVEGALAEIGDSFAAQRTDINQNTTDIATNTAAIAGISDTDDQNASEVAVTTNANLTSNTVQSALEELQTEILANGSNISTNTTNISSNATDIGTNTSNISTNTSNIGTNTTNISTNASSISALEALTSKTDSFEVSADDLDGSDYTLTETAKTQHGIQVSVNGAVTTDFTFALNKVTLSGPVYKYDKIVVSYTY